MAQLDASKQAGQWARLDKQVQTAEARLHQAEQETSPSQSSPSQSSPSEFAKQQPEYARQKEGHSSAEETSPLVAEGTEVDGRQAQLRTIASDLLYWKGRLKVLHQVQLPKWRGCFQWQIEANIEALQTAYTTLRAEVAKPDG